MLQNLTYVIFLISGFPIGMILARLCKDEIRVWRKRLFLLAILFLALSVYLSFTSFEYGFHITLTSLFIIIVLLTIIWRTYQTPRPKRDLVDEFMS